MARSARTQWSVGQTGPRRAALAAAAAALATAALVPLTAATAGAAVSTGTGAATAGVGMAPGAPGDPSFFDLARKDCVGTATGTASKVWYTVAGGVLSDTYEPTIDNTNVSTLQYIVTNGSSFTDLQTRDMTYTVRADPTGMACTVTATDAAHGYRLRAYRCSPDTRVPEPGTKLSRVCISTVSRAGSVR